MHIELDQDGLRRHAQAAGIDIYKFYGRQFAERTGLSQPGITQAPELSWQGRIDAFIGGIPVVDE
jgi:hypothetical protein